MMFPSVFLLIGGVARLLILSKREAFPADMTRNWLYFVKMVKKKNLLLTIKLFVSNSLISFCSIIIITTITKN